MVLVRENLAMSEEKARSFLGRIVKSPLDALAAASGVKGKNEVWFPRSKEDVASAVTLSQDQRASFRSGTQADAATDAVDAAGGIVINLAGLKKVDVASGVASAEAAATTGAMAKALAEHDLALPLGDNPR